MGRGEVTSVVGDEDPVAVLSRLDAIKTYHEYLRDSSGRNLRSHPTNERGRGKYN